VKASSSSTGGTQTPPEGPRGIAEPLATERRRNIVARLRPLGYSYRQIVQFLAERVTPPIHVSIQTIATDIEKIYADFRRLYSARGFDARVYIAETVARYDATEMLAMRLARAEKDTGKAAQLLRVANESRRLKTDLLQDTHFVPRNLGTLYFGDEDEGAKVERVPSGEELWKLFESVNVIEGELVSSAERAWLYGDAEAAERSGQEAGGPPDERRRLPPAEPSDK
jgi:hypothetical protein